MRIEIDKFSGENEFLSNFYPVDVEFDGVTFSSVEHAYQAAKSIFPEDREKIRKCEPPGQAKRKGTEKRIREDWDAVKVEIMLELVAQKFESNEQLKEKLLATGNAILIEGNWWNDTFWGVCNGEGKNTLGVIIMFIRTQIIKSQSE